MPGCRITTFAAGAAMLAGAYSAHAEDPGAAGRPFMVAAAQREQPLADTVTPVTQTPMQQADQIIAGSQLGFGSAAGKPGSGEGVALTMISGANGSCTREIVYSGNPAAPIARIKLTGDACGRNVEPPAPPEATPKAAQKPHVDERHGATPQLAQLGTPVRGGSRIA